MFRDRCRPAAQIFFVAIVALGLPVALGAASQDCGNTPSYDIGFEVTGGPEGPSGEGAYLYYRAGGPVLWGSPEARSTGRPSAATGATTTLSGSSSRRTKPGCG